MKSTYKNCPKCGSNKVVKNGIQSGRRRYKCKECGKKFQNKQVTSRNNSAIINNLVFKKNHIQI